jgi:shikimate kinase
MTSPHPALNIDEATQQLAQNLAEHPAMTRIVITGFMGCGKSTIGRKLSQAMGFGFVDTDTMIEQRRGKKCGDIIHEEGEPAFRRYERDALEKAITLERTIIATGGGALVRQDNLDLALDEAIVVYLDVETDDLLERILFSPKDRPLIDVPDPKPVVEEMLDKRLPYYEQAQVHVDATNLSANETLTAILGALDRYVRYFLPMLEPATPSKEG